MFRPKARSVSPEGGKRGCISGIVRRVVDRKTVIRKYLANRGIQVNDGSSRTISASPSPATSGAGRKAFLSRLTAVATLGGLLFGFDTGVISGALLYMRDDLGMSSLQEALVVTMILFPGAASGAIVGGPLADRVGRKRTLLVCSLVFLIGTLGCAFATGVASLMLFRVILGWAVGCASVTCPIYLAEMAPANRRSRMVTINELMIVTGLFLSFTTNLIFDGLIDNPAVWRYMLGIAAVPAVALFVGMLFLPDSPRWYALKGRYDESRRTLLLGRDEETAERDFRQITQVVEDDGGEQRSIRDVIQTLRENRWMRRILWIGIVWSIAFIVPGQNVVNYYAPTVLADAGMSNSSALISATSVGITLIVATLIGIWLLGYVPVRRMMLTGFAVIIVAHALLAITYSTPESPARAFTILGLMLCVNGTMSCLLGTSGWLVLSEIFPVAIRGFAMGCAVMTLWITNAAITFFFPLMVERVGMVAIFSGFVVLNAIAFLFVAKFIPETKGKTLEELEEQIRAAGTRK